MATGAVRVSKIVLTIYGRGWSVGEWVCRESVAKKKHFKIVLET